MAFRLPLSIATIRRNLFLCGRACTQPAIYGYWALSFSFFLLETDLSVQGSGILLSPPIHYQYVQSVCLVCGHSAHIRRCETASIVRLGRIGSPVSAVACLQL